MKVDSFPWYISFLSSYYIISNVLSNVHALDGFLEIYHKIWTKLEKWLDFLKISIKELSTIYIKELYHPYQKALKCIIENFSLFKNQKSTLPIKKLTQSNSNPSQRRQCLLYFVDNFTFSRHYSVKQKRLIIESVFWKKLK